MAECYRCRNWDPGDPSVGIFPSCASAHLYDDEEEIKSDELDEIQNIISQGKRCPYFVDKDLPEGVEVISMTKLRFLEIAKNYEVNRTGQEFEIRPSWGGNLTAFIRPAEGMFESEIEYCVRSSRTEYVTVNVKDLLELQEFCEELVKE